ncbi:MULTISPECIES: spore maturation protein [Virgibacillus]|uniref:Spore maturation protein B n=2 Tax=Virgibacillus TaxID=84406 RepID=A0A024QB43_9BACI|nr:MULTISPECIES: spore maturation protein [Virgibacillus]EQB36068.1 spore maturation protein [Virgibacillus sp. CM-4]MYL41933.1 spore maturation protein [Virgibacillus massiliensis]GGJ46914.1 spore maturation protein B [Virgibacillus kapii]CDQ39763.1 Spore maturation protein B [Virgibacillus massiliensis]
MGFITSMSIWLIPCFILVVLITATVKRVPSYELFVEGGKEGVKMAFSLLPFLVGMIVSISILRSSGALDAFINLISPFLSFIGIPPDIIPLAIVRPISGTAALGMTTELIDAYGPDSFIGRLASVMQGSTDTTLYILTVYFGAIGIRKMGYALKVGLLADLVGIIASIVIVSILFG